MGKQLDIALEVIAKRVGRDAITQLDRAESFNVETISTGITALDEALGVGGIPRGRVVEIFGAASSGKTALALYDSRASTGERRYGCIYRYGVCIKSCACKGERS